MGTFIKPIETKYKGCLFRSRLEARWAVYFDVAGIEWEYEKEGFALPSGWYLPDFWLPQVRLWAEVKPFDFAELELRRCRELAGATGHGCLILNGSPANRFYACVHSGAWIDEFELNRSYLDESRFFHSGCECDDPNNPSDGGSGDTDAVESAKNFRFWSR